MNLKSFFVATLSSALELGIAIPDDVIRHVTPDVLSTYLPRPLWARLIAACLGAARTDAPLIVETIGVPNLCEHIPATILWACIAEIGQRSLGGVVMAPASAPGSRPVAANASRPVPLATPPPPPATEPRLAAQPTAVGPSIPAPGSDDGDPSRARAAPGQRFRPSTSGVGRLATNSGARRPQAQATPPAPPPPVDAARTDAIPRVKRGSSEADFDLETYVGGKDDWKNALAVEDEQLVDWAASDETVTGGDDASGKR